jgi:SNF2 family DNA or RNA helicase
MDKSIISDPPEKQAMNVFCSLTKEQASLYTAVLNDVEVELRGLETAGTFESLWTNARTLWSDSRGGRLSRCWRGHFFSNKPDKALMKASLT